MPDSPRPGIVVGGRRGRRFTALERREQILSEAAALFSEKGLNGTRVRDIADACGVTEAILYRHFPSKDALFEAALSEQIARHDTEGFLASLPEGLSLEGTFQAVARLILDIGLEDPVIHRLLLTASLSGSARTQGIYVTWRVPFVQHLERLVRQGIERGELRPVDPLLTARAFVGMVMDCVLSCRLWTEIGYDAMHPAALVDNNVPTFVRGLQRDPEKP